LGEELIESCRSDLLDKFSVEFYSNILPFFFEAVSSNSKRVPMRWWGRKSAKSVYDLLEVLMVRENSRGDAEDGNFEVLWNSPAPSKLIVLTLKLLLDRRNLAVRRVLSQEDSRNCVLCHGREEMFDHIFLHCTLRCFEAEVLLLSLSACRSMFFFLVC